MSRGFGRLLLQDSFRIVHFVCRYESWLGCQFVGVLGSSCSAKQNSCLLEMLISTLVG